MDDAVRVHWTNATNLRGEPLITEIPRDLWDAYTPQRQSELIEELRTGVAEYIATRHFVIADVRVAKIEA